MTLACVLQAGILLKFCRVSGTDVRRNVVRGVPWSRQRGSFDSVNFDSGGLQAGSRAKPTTRARCMSPRLQGGARLFSLAAIESSPDVGWLLHFDRSVLCEITYVTPSMGWFWFRSSQSSEE